MLEIMHHEDDGTEQEYWAIYDDCVPGEKSILETFDTKKEAIKALEKIESKRDEIETREAAAFLGRKGGASRSKAKQAASRENGKLGGRPRNKKKPA
jgi:hypothetical protein